MLTDKKFVNNQDENLQKPASNTHPNATEGTGVGGHKFGQNNLTPARRGKNNPSRNAGYNNAYFRRTEPSGEHPEFSNFKPAAQEGAPDYDKAQPYAKLTNDAAKAATPYPDALGWQPDINKPGRGDNGNREHVET